MRRSPALANYPRAPLGGPEHLPDEYRQRFSFCCERDGCRKRLTPPSVSFLGRKVYLGAVVVLIAHAKGRRRAGCASFRVFSGSTAQTMARWQTFWRDRFPQTPFWKIAGARLVPVVEMSACRTRWWMASLAVVRLAQGGAFAAVSLTNHDPGRP